MNTYSVRPGDTLSQIAQRYNVPMSSISGYSSGNPNMIRVGEQLRLPANSANTSTSQGSVYTPPPAIKPPAPSFASSQPSSSANLGMSKPTSTANNNISSPVSQKTTLTPSNKPASSTSQTAQPNWFDQQAQDIGNTPVPKAYAAENTATQSPQSTPTTDHPTATQATAQAIKNGANPAILDRARQYLGTQDYVGLCEAFVERATKGREGIYPSAIAAWNQQLNKAQTDLSNIKPGDSVYFAPDASNGGYGHTGVYIGNNQFIGATYNGIKQFDLGDWIHSTGQKLLGFVPSEGGGAGNTLADMGKTAAGWVGQQVQNAISSPSYVNGTPDWVKPYIDQASKNFNIPSVLLSAHLKKESGFNPNAQSSVGGLGIAQFMPEIAQQLGVNPYNPSDSINAAAQYLRQQWDHFGSPELALASYNSGAGNVRKFGGIPPFKSTKNYVKHIMDMAGDVHRTAYDPTLDIINQARS